MRRIAVLVAATLLLAFPAIAVAKTVNYSFTLGKAGRTFKFHLAHTGRIEIVLRYSRIRNPRADIIASLRTPSDPEGNVIIDSGDKTGCPRVGDSVYCKVYISGEPAGKYSLGIGLETKAKVITHLQLSWPAR